MSINPRIVNDDVLPLKHPVPHPLFLLANQLNFELVIFLLFEW